MVADPGESRHDHEVARPKFHSQGFPFLVGVPDQEDAAEAEAVGENGVPLVDFAVVQVPCHVVPGLVEVNYDGLTLVVKLGARQQLKQVDCLSSNGCDGLGHANLH